MKEGGITVPIFRTLLLLFTGNANALEEIDPFALSPQQLFSATVMSATKTDDTWWNTPAAVYVLDSEDIARAGATSIPEALRLVPGVQVARINTGGWALTIRGFNGDLANKLLVLMDGREVYNHLFSGVYWDVQDTLLEDIDRIEVIRGPGATLWGANAVNGIINIITKTAAETQGTLVSTLAGNQEKIGVARYGGKTKDGTAYRIYGKGFNRDGLDPLPGNLRAGDWNQGRGGFRLDSGEFTLQGDAYSSRTGAFYNAPSLTPPHAVLTHEITSARGSNILTRWTHKRGENQRLTIQSYLDYERRESLLLTDETASFDFDTQYEFSPSLHHRTVAGGRLRYTLNELTGSPAARFGEEWRNDPLISAFVQDKITLDPERWFLTLGSKFEHHYFTGFEIEPGAQLQFHPNNRQMLWASLARAVRTPSVLERDDTILLAVVRMPGAPVPISVPVVPSPHLDSEDLLAHEIGYRHRLTSGLMLDVTTFYNDYRKLASNVVLAPSVVNNGIDPIHFQLPIQIQNLTTGSTYGFETMLDWQAHENLNLSASLSLFKMELHGPSSIALDPEAAEGRSPQQQFNLLARWNPTDATTFDSTLYYVSELGGLGIGDYWRLDLHWGWEIDQQMSFDLAGQNLLNGKHQEFRLDPSGRNVEISPVVYGKLTWRL